MTSKQAGCVQEMEPGCWSSLGEASPSAHTGEQIMQSLDSVNWSHKIERLYRGFKLLVKKGGGSLSLFSTGLPQAGPGLIR